MKKILYISGILLMVVSLSGQADAQSNKEEQSAHKQVIAPPAIMQKVPGPPVRIEKLQDEKKDTSLVIPKAVAPSLPSFKPVPAQKTTPRPPVEDPKTRLVAIDSVLMLNLINSDKKKELDSYVSQTIQQADTAKNKALVTASIADTLSRASIVRKDDTELQTKAVNLYQKALPSLTGAARLQTTNNYATILLKQDKAMQALEELQPLKTEYEQSSDTQGKTAYFYNLGRAYEKSSQPDLAKAAYQQAAFVDPSFSPASRAVSRLLPQVKQDTASLAQTADWLNAVTYSGDLAVAQKNIRTALDSPNLYTKDGFEKILLSFIFYLVEGKCSPERFESVWIPALPPLESMYSMAQGMVKEIKAVYSDDFPVVFRPGYGLRYLRSSAAAAQQTGQPDLPTHFVKAVADRFRAAGTPQKALQRYAMAWTIDTTNMEAAYGIVNVLFERSEQAAEGSDELLNRFIDELFELKGMAYKAPVGDDWENILRMHLVLGSIYSRKEIWGHPYDPRSAIFQLERAVQTHSRLIESGRSEAAGPIAGVKYALAKAYDKSGNPRKAGRMFLHAAESAIMEKDKSYARQIIDEVETQQDRFHLSTRDQKKIESLRARIAQPEKGPS